jgi:hypothetical protein
MKDGDLMLWIGVGSLVLSGILAYELMQSQKQATTTTQAQKTTTKTSTTTPTGGCGGCS